MNFFERLLVSLGLAEEKEEEEEGFEDDITEEKKGNKEKSKSSKSKKGSVVPLPTKVKDTDYSIIVVTPTEYDQAQKISEYLKKSQPVIVNLEKLDVEIGRQLIDFVSGTVFGLDGTINKIGKQMFLFSPPGVEVISDMETGLSENEWRNFD